MRPVKLYFAGDDSGISFCEGYGKLILKRLCSFAYPKQFYNWMEAFKGVNGAEVIIDSGAFSAWNKGESVDLDAYVSYTKEVIDKCSQCGKKVRVVNLDVIPGKVGKTSELLSRFNLQAFKDSAKKGMVNLLRFVDEGIIPIHVFHQGESFK